MDQIIFIFLIQDNGDLKVKERDSIKNGIKEISKKQMKMKEKRKKQKVGLMEKKKVIKMKRIIMIMNWMNLKKKKETKSEISTNYFPNMMKRLVHEGKT